MRPEDIPAFYKQWSDDKSFEHSNCMTSGMSVRLAALQFNVPKSTSYSRRPSQCTCAVWSCKWPYYVFDGCKRGEVLVWPPALFSNWICPIHRRNFQLAWHTNISRTPIFVFSQSGQTRLSLKIGLDFWPYSSIFLKFYVHTDILKVSIVVYNYGTAFALWPAANF